MHLLFNRCIDYIFDVSIYIDASIKLIHRLIDASIDMNRSIYYVDASINPIQLFDA